jgi:hypothetical protein
MGVDFVLLIVCWSMHLAVCETARPVQRHLQARAGTGEALRRAWELILCC